MMFPNCSELSERKRQIICIVPGCESRFNKNLNVSFHYFPPALKYYVNIENIFGNQEKVDLLSAWKKVLKIKNVTKSMRICSLHFKPDDYIFPNIYAKRRFLKKNSVPSLNLPEQKNEKVIKRRDNRLLQRNLKKQELKQQMEIKQPINIEEHADARVVEVNKDVPLNIEEDINELVEDTEEIIVRPVMCDIGLQVTTDLIIPKFTDFIKTDAELWALSGIESFQILRTIVDIVLESFGYKLQHHNNKMNAHDKVLMTYVKLKHNLSYSFLALMFPYCTARNCELIFIEMIQILSECLKIAIVWPSRETISKNLPECFKGFEDVRVVLKCTEIMIERQKNPCCNHTTFSSHKKSQTCKFMTGITPAGNISYISRVYGGRTSGTEIFAKSDIQTLLEREDAIVVDKNFKIDDICISNGWKCYKPSYLQGKKQYSELNAILTCNTSKATVHIMRFNQSTKKFKILRDTISTALIPYIEYIFIVLCATMNLSTPILKDDMFMVQ